MAVSPNIEELDNLRLLQDLLRSRLPLSVDGIPAELDEMPSIDLILRDLAAEELPESSGMDERVATGPHKG